MSLRNVNGVQALGMGKEEIALFAGTCGHGFLGMRGCVDRLLDG